MKELNINYELSEQNRNIESFNGAALHIAIQFNRMDCFELLLNCKNIDVNQPVHFSQITPLMMCSIYGRIQMARIFAIGKMR